MDNENAPRLPVNHKHIKSLAWNEILFTNGDNEISIMVMPLQEQINMLANAIIPMKDRYHDPL